MNCLIVLLLCVTTVVASQSSPEYKFSYSTGEGSARMFREESKDHNGLVVGKYGYVDPYGTMRVVQYQSDAKSGFIARGDIGPDQEAMKIARQLAEDDAREKAPFLQHWNAIAASRTIAPEPFRNNEEHLKQYSHHAKLLALNPPKTQDWSSGAAVSSFMQSIGYPAVADANSYKYASISQAPALPALPAAPVSQSYLSQSTYNAPSNAHTFVSLNQGTGSDGFNYQYYY